MPSTAHSARSALPSLNREGWTNLALAIALLAAPLVATAVGEPYYVSLVTRVAILALAASALNFAVGYAGLVSFGHAAFLGIGGFTAGILSHHAFEMSPILEWPILVEGTENALIAWPMAMIAAGLVALVVGAISLRTSGVYFIMITLAFAQMFYYLAISLPTYGGEDGLPLYQRAQLPYVSTDDNLTIFGVAYGSLMVFLYLTHRAVGARFGTAIEGARQNPARLLAAGIPDYPYRLAAFVASGMVAGLAGALTAELDGFVGPTLLSWHRSGELLVMVILGGVGRLFGALAGAAAFILLETVIGSYTEHWQLFLGILLLGIVLYARGGLIGALAGRRSHG